LDFVFFALAFLAFAFVAADFFFEID